MHEVRRLGNRLKPNNHAAFRPKVAPKSSDYAGSTPVKKSGTRTFGFYRKFVLRALGNDEKIVKSDILRASGQAGMPRASAAGPKSRRGGLSWSLEGAKRDGAAVTPMPRNNNVIVRRSSEVPQAGRGFRPRQKRSSNRRSIGVESACAGDARRRRRRRGRG